MIHRDSILGSHGVGAAEMLQHKLIRRCLTYHEADVNWSPGNKNVSNIEHDPNRRLDPGPMSHLNASGSSGRIVIRRLDPLDGPDRILYIIWTGPTKHKLRGDTLFCQHRCAHLKSWLVNQMGLRTPFGHKHHLLGHRPHTNTLPA